MPSPRYISAVQSAILLAVAIFFGKSRIVEAALYNPDGRLRHITCALSGDGAPQRLGRRSFCATLFGGGYRLRRRGKRRLRGAHQSLKVCHSRRSLRVHVSFLPKTGSGRSAALGHFSQSLRVHRPRGSGSGPALTGVIDQGRGSKVGCWGTRVSEWCTLVHPGENDVRKIVPRQPRAILRIRNSSYVK